MMLVLKDKEDKEKVLIVDFQNKILVIKKGKTKETFAFDDASFSFFIKLLGVAYERMGEDLPKAS